MIETTDSSIIKALRRLLRKCDRCPRRPTRFAVVKDVWAGDGFPDDYRLRGYCALHTPRDGDRVVELDEPLVVALVLERLQYRDDLASWPVAQLVARAGPAWYVEAIAPRLGISLAH